MNNPNIIYTGQSKPDIIITQRCKWCDGEDHIIAKDDYVILGMGGNYLFANGDDAVSVEINFCPMCGRQLNA